MKSAVNLPVDVSTGPGTPTDQDDSDCGVLKIEAPNPLHYVVGVGAVDNVVSHSNTERTMNDYAACPPESTDKAFDFPLIVMVIGDEDFPPQYGW